MDRTTTMPKSGRKYLPAAGHDIFLPFYDLITRLLGADSARAALLDQAGLRPGQRVLDVGCGTGSLVVLVEKLHPEVEAVGLDPDAKALARARRKAQRARVPSRFDQGFSDTMEYPPASFDHVFSSFMFHHLENDQKLETLRQVGRVLKPGGYLHLLDFTGPGDAGHSGLSRWFHRGHRLADNAESKVLGLMRQSGLADAKVVGRRALLLGLVHAAYYRATAPPHAR